MKLVIPLLNRKTWTTEAEKIGDLAIHPDYKDGATWSVTHLPTLASMKAAVPKEMLRSRTKLKEWCLEVQTDLQADWKALRKLNPKDVKDHPEKSHELRGRIRELCLKTKV